MNQERKRPVSPGAFWKDQGALYRGRNDASEDGDFSRKTVISIVVAGRWGWVKRMDTASGGRFLRLRNGCGEPRLQTVEDSAQDT